MKNKNHPKLLRSMMLAATFGITLAANAADDFQGFTVSGHLDYYYMFDFGNPGVMQGTNLRQFDVLPGQFSFAVAEVDVTRKATAKDPFGITANFVVGNNADIMAANEPAGQNSTKLLQQLYVTYAVPKTPDTTIDFGKFLSWIGYEGVDSSTDDNYSRSFLFTLGQPIYNTGFRGSATLAKNVTGNLYVVNGWNEVQDSNGGTSYGATLGLTPNAKSAITLNYYGGQEGSDGTSGIAFTSPGARDVNLGDLVATYQLTPKYKVAVNADYADAQGFDGSSSGNWSGVAGYFTAQFTDKLTGALRAETFNDSDGLRATGQSARFDSLTGTLSWNMTKDSLLRVELRYDQSNLAAFNADNGSLKDNRTTLTFSHVLKF